MDVATTQTVKQAPYKPIAQKGSTNGMTPGRRTVATEPKTPNAFALFVKGNYKQARTPGSTHKEAMNQLSKMFAQSKIQN